jgi:hypothetical protein
VARVEFAPPADLVIDAAGNVLTGRTVTAKLAGTATLVTHYSALTGGTSTTGGLFTGTDGTIVDGTGARRYVDSGISIDLTISGRSRQVEAISALSVPPSSDVAAATDRDVLTMKSGSVRVGAPADVVFNSLNFTGAFSATPSVSAAALDLAIAACIPATDPVTTTRQATRRLHLPPGTYERDSGSPVFSLRSVQGFNLRTGGAQATIFKQKATAASVVDFDGVARSHFDGFSVSSDSTVVVTTGVQVYWDNAGTTPSGQAARSTLELDFEYVEVSNFWGVTGMQLGYDGFSDQVDGISIGHISMTGGWSPLAVTGVAATDLFTSTAHGFTAGSQVVFTDKTAGVGVTVGTTYFVIASGLTANDFKVSTTLGGATIDLTSDMTGGHVGRVDLWQSGLKVGHGVTGNNFLHNVGLLSVTNYRRNLHMARAGLHVDLARLQSGEHDIYLDGPSNHGVTVEHGRSESSVRFIGSANFGTVGCSLHVKDYKWGPGANTAVDREIVSYHFPGTAIFDNIQITPAPPTSVCWANFGPTRPLALFINGWSNEGVEASAFVFGTSVDANMEGYTRLSGGAVQADALTPTIASAATLTLPWSVETVFVSGTADITAITTSGHAGRTRRLIFTGTFATNGVVDNGTTLNLAGNLAYTPNDSLTLYCDGTNWYETGRSVN